MFTESNQLYADSTGLGRECKPDYEHILQTFRERNLKARADIDAFHSITSLNIHQSSTRDAALLLLGALHVELKETEARIQDTLKQIDKAAEED